MTVCKKPEILAVVGPTASGKSALALELCKRLGGEIVSCDSMQIYRGMDIGTAKPTAAEMREVPHHLIDIADPEEEFSVMDFVAAAERATEDILSRGRMPVFCGGTGLYLDAFLRGGVAETPGADPVLRAELNALADTCGAEHLHAMLKEVDPESADTVHPNNVRRVIRALEIYRATGIPKSEWDRRSLQMPSRYNATVLGLSYSDRELLYRRIEARVDQMLEEGLVEETRRLMERGVFEVSRTACAAIGYKELLPYLRGEQTLNEAVSELKTATRRYAKRQMTWFLAKPYVHWIEANDGNLVRKSEEIVNMSLQVFLKHKNML
ncbi:MAG: tRNA (adenosine(37)-N6)-dimethylallyltransferase MiaA [Clostridia bacterium]|nr:tRNA (adenosine(37)-N6)-dimethylallyltransferase MiaA [Clostridia bacterium]